MDNEVDGEAWEKLGAIKMPEHMANEVFGNNIRYADNTTCVITENQDNPAFPYNVNFDASKITAKPKRDTGTLAGIGMPSKKVITISPNFYQTANGTWVSKHVAPVNGYAFFLFQAGATSAGFAIHSSVLSSFVNVLAYQYSAVFLPVKKGDNYEFDFIGSSNNNIWLKFICAQGEI